MSIKSGTLQGEPVAVRVGLEDLSGLAESERETRMRGGAARQAREPFDLQAGPLLRVRLLRLGDTEHVLLITMHHIVSDGWSLDVFLGELAALYEAFSRGQSSPLPPLAVQYADFAVWQREHLSADTVAADLAYWRARLEGAPPVLELPADFSRPVGPSTAGGAVAATLSRQLTGQLAALSRAEGATLFMTLLAAFQALLGRYAGSQDVVVGSPIAGRTRAETEALIGFFVNTLVLRTDLSGNPSFRQLLTRVRETALGAYVHQDLPFEQLVEALDPVRDLSHNPLFQVMFNYFNDISTLPRVTKFAGLALEFVEPVEPSPKFFLTLYAHESDGRVGLRLVYQTSRFTQTRMRGVLDQLVYLLEQIADDPDRPLDGYSLVSAGSMVALPDPAAPVVEQGFPLVSGMIRAWVRSCPQAIALEQGDRACSYAQLRVWAEGIVAALAAQGLGNGDVVAVFGPPSPGLVAAMVAVVSSPGVLLTLDQRLPDHRLQVMLDQARAGFLILVEDSPGAQPPPVSLDGLRVLRVDAASPTVTGPGGRREVPSAVIAPGGPAYVFFTSGTTGVPKGVVGRHNGLSHFLSWQRDSFGIGPGDRCALLTGLSFDVVLRDVFLPLVSGATLCLPSAEDQAAEQMIGWLAEARITCAHVVPTLAHAWLEHDADADADADAEPATALRYTFFAGEPLTDQLVARWRQACPHTGIVNLYGPTETTLATCWYPVPASPSAGVQPVGGPLPGTQALVLGSGERLCGIGEIGEIVVRSPYRSLGYLHPPAGNQPTFVPNPHTGDPTDLLYRTGDQGRYRPDGALEVLGRLDRQVKIRGVRIEPDEIAAVLTTHPAVSHAVVATQTDERGQATLVAYLTTSGPTPPTRAQLRSYLALRLPTVMMPGAVVLLDHMPLTANGKIDYQALPPAPLNNTTTPQHTPPRSPVEEVLCAIWAQVLGIDRVGIEDDFFDLGGHSLLAIRVINQVRSVLGVELVVRVLFEAPTVAGLAHRVAGAGRARLALTPYERPDVVPLSFAQRRLWFLHQMEGPSPTYNIPLVLRLSGDLDHPALHAALGDVIARHESLRTIFPQTDGVPYQQVLDLNAVCPQLPVTAASETTLPEVLAGATRYGFDLATQAPVRAELFVLAPDEHVLLILVHHIAGDGWSRGPLSRDLATAYAARCHGQAPGWAPLAVQYADYTLWQHQLLGQHTDPDSLFATQLAYWTHTLAGLPEQLVLPTDRPRPPVASYRGAHLTIHLDAALHHGLRDLARRNGASVFMVLQAGLAALLSRLGAGDDIPIGSPIAGRTDQALDELVGFFVNTLVLRTDTTGNPTFTQLLAQVRETALNAYAHQDVPFEYLVEVLNPTRSLAHHPLFQIMLALHNAPEGDFELPGLQVSGVWTPTATSRFDLSVSLSEQRGKDGAPQGIHGVVEYSSDLFDATTIETLLARWTRLLHAAVTDPDRPISRIDILSTEERARLLVDYNNTTTPMPSATLPALFATQVHATPDAVAVVSGDTTLTYAQLNAHANQLAHALITRGVGPERAVALLLERSVGLVVSILAVLKAGGTYVPLDTRYPASRMCLVMQETGASVLLTDQALAAQEFPHRADVIFVDADPGLAEQDPGDPGIVCDPDQLAYVMYTSGSAGQPKGIAVTHRDVASLALDPCWHGGDHQRVLVHSPSAFDASTYELWVPLLSGGQAVITPPGEVDIRTLERVIIQNKITGLWLTAGLFDLMAEQCRGCFAGVRQVWTGGDVVSAAAVARVLDACPATTVVNGYGPTETTTFAAHHRMRAPYDAAHTVPIGRPLANTRLYVLDAGLQPMPPGVTGELYIAGAGLARGYLHQPGLTAQRFVADLYSPRSGRMYRTGDLVRWRPDGNLEFVGRADEQVKLRGFRIEPGEIETVLAAHPDVAQAAVVARQDQPGDKRLVAYVVPPTENRATDSAVQPERLRDYLRERLPEYMVPSALLMLDALPLTPNGKVDRNALPAPEFGSAGTGRAPRTPQEQLLVELFAEVLGLAGVGIDDDFFDLGGHSLLATRLIARVRATLGVELGLRALFQAPTVAGLAGCLDMDDTHDALEVILPLRSQGCHSPLFCIHPAGGLSWSYCGLMTHLGPDYPIYAVQARGIAQPQPLPTSIEQMAADYTDQIRQVQPAGPYHLLGWSFGGLVAHAVATELHQRGEQTALLAILDAFPVRDLSPEEPPVPTERDIRVLLLQGDPKSDEPVTFAQFVDILRSRGSALANLEEHHLSAITEIMTNNIRLVRDFTPGDFPGDLLLFTPTLDQGHDVASPGAWRPYIGGTIENHDITSKHHLMTQPESLAQIGPILAAKLHDITSNTSPSHRKS